MKNLGVIVTITLALIGGFMGYGALQADTKNTKEKVEEVKVEVKDNDKDIKELQEYSIRQSMILERQMIILDKLEGKLDE